MVDTALSRCGVSLSVKITVKSIISATLVALAVALPQLVHAIAGAPGGVKWLPMYLPVLVAGCILGPWWGIGVGIMSPLVSFGITSAMGNAMPVAARLPYMMAELAVFAAVSGIFSRRIPQNKWLAFPAVLLASVAGRAVFVALAAMTGGVGTLSFAAVWAQVQTGFLAVIAQAVLVPLAVIGIATLMQKDTPQA